MKIQLKPVTVTYTKTLVIFPTDEMFEDWDCEPCQESFEEMATEELYEQIYNDVSGNSYGKKEESTKCLINVKQIENKIIEIDWPIDEEDDD